jgi:hypothetical protein
VPPPDFNDPAPQVKEDPTAAKLKVAKLYQEQAQKFAKDGAMPASRDAATVALEMHQSLLGEEHAETALDHELIGEAWSALGDHKKAARAHNNALQARVKVFGELSLETARSCDLLAEEFEVFDELDGALDLRDVAVKARNHVLGEKHPETARAYFLLGHTLHLSASHAESDEEFEEAATEAHQALAQALVIQKETLGQDHLDTAGTLHETAHLYYEERDYAKAKELFSASLLIHRKLLGDRARRTAHDFFYLGKVEASLGNESSARVAFEDAFSIQKAILQLDDEELGETADKLCNIYIRAREGARAVAACEIALQVSRHVHGEESELTAMSYHSLGYAHRIAGDPKQALEYLRKAQPVLEAKKNAVAGVTTALIGALCKEGYKPACEPQ